MALVRINRNGTYYEMYHVANEQIAAECSRLVSHGLNYQTKSDEPATNSFTVMQHTILLTSVDQPMVSVA